MDMAEFDFNIAEGEFSSKADGTSVTLVYGEDEYDSRGYDMGYKENEDDE